jgi:hypothetical protein
MLPPRAVTGTDNDRDARCSDFSSEPRPDPTREFRDAIEKHISSTEMSRDGYKVPSVSVVVNGDIDTLRSVLDRLQAGQPVVCLGDTGGAAQDLYMYAHTNQMPPEGKPPEGRERSYLLEAGELMPMIVKEGAEQGGSTKPKLSFFLAYDDADGNEIDFCIMQSMLNSCSSINEEIMLAVGCPHAQPRTTCPREDTRAPAPVGVARAVHARRTRAQARRRMHRRSRACFSFGQGATWPSWRRCSSVRRRMTTKGSRSRCSWR